MECIPCIIRQTIEVTHLLDLDTKKKKEVVREVMKVLHRIPVTDMTPPEATEIVHDVLKSLTQEKDLYKSVKKKFNEEALGLYSKMKKLIRQSADPLDTAVRLSIAGNVIDFGAHSTFDVEKTIEEVLTQKFAIDHSDKFREKLERAKNILFIGDNAGEIVFDKLLVEELLPKVEFLTYAVKSEPILNDATLEDAEEVKMTTLTQVIETGSKSPGTFLNLTTPEFKEAYRKADLVIAKGQGNYETMEDLKDKPIFFLFKVKCPYLAEAIGVKKGDIVLFKSQ